MDTELTLEQALLAAQLGDKKRARRILRAIIRQEPLNERAWLLFAEFAEKPEQTTAWVEHVLKINSNNAMARQKLAILGNSNRPGALQPRQAPEQPPLTLAPITLAVPAAKPPVIANLPTRFILQRLLLIPVALVLANFLGFAYAHFALYQHMKRNPFFAPLERPDPVLPAYVDYGQKALHFDFGTIQIGAGLPVQDAVFKAASASLGLLAVAFVFSILLGALLGMRAVRVEPPGVAAWLAPLSTFGLALPSFYAGAIFVVGAVAFALRFGPDAPSIPISGFGWDLHLVFPALALMLRPTVQIAQVAAASLAGELGKRYIVTARSVGNPWRTVRWKHALRNSIAPVILTIAGSFRLLMGELIVVEWLFSWPGLGRLLASILIPARGSHEAEAILFLHPAALAATLAAFALFFLLADLAASALVRMFDPRLRALEGEAK